MQTYTNNDLLENIRLRALMPNSQTLYTPERLLLLADDELKTVIFPMIMSIKGDYFVHADRQTLTTDLTYPIPSEAVGTKVKDVYWRDPNWPANQPSRLIPLINYQDYTNQGAGLFNLMAYFIQGNNVHLTNTQAGKTLEILFYKRAYKLVEDEYGAQITGVSGSVITVSSVPQSWVVGDVLTLTSQLPPFNTLTTTLEIDVIAGNDLTLTQTDSDESLPLSTDIGNWLTLGGETVIAQITPEAHPILAQSVAVKVLEGLNDPGLGVSQSKFNQLYKAFIDTMTPRTDGQAKKLIQRNGTLYWNKIQRGSRIGGR